MISNGLLQPMLFGGMRQVVDRLNASRPDDLVIRFSRWRDCDGITAWLDEHRFDYINMLGYSYGGSTNAFVAKERPRQRVKNFVGVDIVWREDKYKIDADSREENHTIDLTRTSIENVKLWRQRQGKITGHGVAVDPGVNYDERYIHFDKFGHLAIDNVEEIIESCVSLLLT